MTRIDNVIRMLGILAFGTLAACASAPKTHAQRSSLEEEAQRTLQEMTMRDPSLNELLDRSAGYVVFPDIKQGGFVVGGASGRGVVFEHGVRTGFAQLSQASFGAQVGGQKYSELVVVRDQFALNKLKAESFDLGAQASAVALTSGASATTRFGDNGIAVFTVPQGGAMLNVSLTGQKIKFSL